MSRTRSDRSLRSLLFDLTIAGCVAFLALVDVQEYGWLSFPTGLGIADALLWRRSRPRTVFAVVAVLAGISVLVFLHARTRHPFPIMAQTVAVPIAMYSVVKYSPRLRDAWLAGGITQAGLLVAIYGGDSGRHRLVTGGAVVLSLMCAAVWLLALTNRTRRLVVEGLKERAATAERERDHLARLAVAEERASIARELHDIVAHSLSVMIVQADGARYALNREPERARAALETVASTGRDALDEMRRLVAVLRGGAQRAAPGAAVELPAAVERPRAALDQLGALVARAEAAGVEVATTVAGRPPKMPAGVELAVYRIVQEAITNAIKHAGVGARVTLRLGYAPDAVEIRVCDSGPERPHPGPRASATLNASNPIGPSAEPEAVPDALPPGGNGLVGLRERVAVYQGTFFAGPRPDGGWLVHARIPIPPRRHGIDTGAVASGGPAAADAWSGDAHALRASEQEAGR